MKGYRGICRDCKHEHKMTVEAPCYNCISNEDLALHKPTEETEYAYFEPKDKKTNKYSKGRAITRGSRLLDICKKAKPFLETDGNYYCYGIIDLRDEESIEDCRKCKAYFRNIDW